MRCFPAVELVAIEAEVSVVRHIHAARHRLEIVGAERAHRDLSAPTVVRRAGGWMPSKGGGKDGSLGL
jgi:hypothetical protein